MASPAAKEQASLVKEYTGKAATIIEYKATEKAVVILLGLALPSGKTLAESTGEECRKAGGWLKKVAERVGPDKLVGEVLSEKQLQQLYGT